MFYRPLSLFYWTTLPLGSIPLPTPCSDEDDITATSNQKNCKIYICTYRIFALYNVNIQRTKYDFDILLMCCFSLGEL